MARVEQANQDCLILFDAHIDLVLNLNEQFVKLRVVQIVPHPNFFLVSFQGPGKLSVVVSILLCRRQIDSVIKTLNASDLVKSLLLDNDKDCFIWPKGRVICLYCVICVARHHTNQV